MPIPIDIQSHWGNSNCQDVTKKKKKERNKLKNRLYKWKWKYTERKVQWHRPDTSSTLCLASFSTDYT